MFVHEAKALGKRRKIIGVISRLMEGIVIVEGKHDTGKLGLFGISAVTFTDVLYRKHKISPEKKVYVMTDNDRNGEEKRSRIIGELLSWNPLAEIDTELGPLFLRMLNVRCAEQIYRPLTEIMENDGESNGKNILRHSEVPNRGKV